MCGCVKRVRMCCVCGMCVYVVCMYVVVSGIIELMMVCVSGI